MSEHFCFTMFFFLKPCAVLEILALPSQKCPALLAYKSLIMLYYHEIMGLVLFASLFSFSQHSAQVWELIDRSPHDLSLCSLSIICGSICSMSPTINQFQKQLQTLC